MCFRCFAHGWLRCAVLCSRQHVSYRSWVFCDLSRRSRFKVNVRTSTRMHSYVLKKGPTTERGNVRGEKKREKTNSGNKMGRKVKKWSRLKRNRSKKEWKTERLSGKNDKAVHGRQHKKKKREEYGWRKEKKKEKEETSYLVKVVVDARVVCRVLFELQSRPCYQVCPEDRHKYE